MSEYSGKMSMQDIRSSLEGLTYEDVIDWAGDKIYQRGKEYVACVSQLSRTEDGALVAWVSGTDEYATWVRVVGAEAIDCDCTCPYDDGPCKHAVAVVLAAAALVKRGRDIPVLDPEDDLFFEAFVDEAEVCDESFDDDTPASCAGLSTGMASELETLLAEKSRDQLRALLMQLAADVPEVGRRIREQGRRETGRVDSVVKLLRGKYAN